MAESLFTTQTPTTQTSEANPGPTLGTVIVVAVDGQVTHGRWWFPNTLPSNAVPFVLYDATTQAELARATFASPTAGAWNTVALPAPVNVTAGQRLVAAIRTADQYAFTSGFFTSSGVTNGNLSAPASSADPVGNGRFQSNLDAYPSSTFGGNCYFVDIVFEPATAGGSDAVLSATLPALTGSLTADASISVGLAAVLPALTGNLTAETDAVAALAAVLPTLTGAFTGQAETSAALAAMLPALTAVLTGQAGPVESVEPGVLTASGRPAATLTAAGTAPTLTARGRP